MHSGPKIFATRVCSDERVIVLFVAETVSDTIYSQKQSPFTFIAIVGEMFFAITHRHHLTHTLRIQILINIVRVPNIELVDNSLNSFAFAECRMILRVAYKYKKTFKYIKWQIKLSVYNLQDTELQRNYKA